MLCSEFSDEVAGRQGFEPRYRGPEPRVLPLDDLPVRSARCDRRELSIIAQQPALGCPVEGRCRTERSLRQVVRAHHLLGIRAGHGLIVIGRLRRRRLFLLPSMARHATFTSGFARPFARPFVSRALLMRRLAAFTGYLPLLAT